MLQKTFTPLKGVQDPVARLNFDLISAQVNQQRIQITSLSESQTTQYAASMTIGSLSPSLPVFTNSAKKLVSNAMTGSGSVVMSASPTGTGTWALASATFSGNIAVTGRINVGGASDLASWTINVAGGGNISTSGGGSFVSYGAGVPGDTNYERMYFEHGGASGARITVNKGSTGGSYRNLAFSVGGSDRFTINAATGYTTTSVFEYFSAKGASQILIDSVGLNIGTIQNDSSNTWSLGYSGTLGSVLGTPVLTWNSSNIVSCAGRLNVGSTLHHSGTVYEFAGGDLTVQSVDDSHALILCGGSQANIVNGARITVYGITGVVPGAIAITPSSGKYISLVGSASFSARLVLVAAAESVVALTADGQDIDVAGISRVFITSTTGAYAVDLTNPTDGQVLSVMNGTATTLAVNGCATIMPAGVGIKIMYRSSNSTWY